MSILSVSDTRYALHTAPDTFTLTILPFWSGRVRHGRIYARFADDSFFAVSYTRNATRWTKADTDLYSFRHGSPKHRALLEILQLTRVIPD